jgi:predicted TIM-barrel enzyme
MAKKYTRAEVRARLQQQIQAGKSLLMFGAGTGLTARCAELGGADLIGIYSTAFYRMQGKASLLAWLPYSNANDQVAERSREILPVIKETPCIAGIGAHDPDRDLGLFMEEMLRIGFSGVTNEPFVGLYGPAFAEELESAGIGFSREVDLIRLANEMDIFSVAWAFTAQEAKRMAEVGADVIGAIVGVTTGGLTGAKKALSLEEASEQVRQMVVAAKEINPQVMVLTHGGPIKDPETAAYSIKHSGAEGYAAGSSGERLPTEQAVIALTKEYKK